MNKTTTPGRDRTITGRKYSRKPRRRVMWVDDFARRLITLSGIGSIAAVSLVGLFLAWVAWPLLMPSQFEKSRLLPSPERGQEREFLASAIDNYGILTWGFNPRGEIVVRSMADGKVLDRLPVGEGEIPTAWSFSVGKGKAVFGYADGRTQTADLQWQVDFLTADEEKLENADLVAGDVRVWQKGLLVRTPEGQLRHQFL